MAETLVQTLNSLTPEAQILVVIGKGHISDQVGVPMVTHQRVADPYRTIAPLPIDYPESTADPRIADFVWLTDRSEQPRHRARLGVKFIPLPAGKGLEIGEVLPGSPAAKAGIKKGDVLIMLDGNPVASLEEARRAFADKLIHELVLKRGGKTVTVTVTLSP
jgi:S1-C subfamily serine protease